MLDEQKERSGVNVKCSQICCRDQVQPGGKVGRSGLTFRHKKNKKKSSHKVCPQLREYFWKTFALIGVQGIEV